MARSVSSIDRKILRAVLRGVKAGGRFGELVIVSGGAANAIFYIDLAVRQKLVERTGAELRLTDDGLRLIRGPSGGIRWIEEAPNMRLAGEVDPWKYFPPKGRLDV